MTTTSQRARTGGAGRPLRHRSTESQSEFKAQLLVHAKRLYLELGHAHLSIRAVTDAVGMSPMAFYGYFASKRDLVKHILLDDFKDLHTCLLAAVSPALAPLDAIRAHVLAGITFWERRPDQYRLAFVSTDDGLGADPIRLDDEPVYQQITALNHERIGACAGECPFSADQIRHLRRCMVIKLFGFLHLTLAIQRYDLADRDVLKGMIVDDIVEMVRRGQVVG